MLASGIDSVGDRWFFRVFAPIPGSCSNATRGPVCPAVHNTAPSWVGVSTYGGGGCGGRDGVAAPSVPTATGGGRPGLRSIASHPTAPTAGGTSEKFPGARGHWALARRWRPRGDGLI